jgi:hypothetical protein
VVATAKRDLAEGEMLDGEGGYTVYGKLMPAADSLRWAACRSAWRTRSSWCGRWRRCFVTEMYVADDRGVGGNPGVASQYGSAIAECVGGHADSLSV